MGLIPAAAVALYTTRDRRIEDRRRDQIAAMADLITSVWNLANEITAQMARRIDEGSGPPQAEIRTDQADDLYQIASASHTRAELVIESPKLRRIVEEIADEQHHLGVAIYALDHPERVQPAPDFRYIAAVADRSTEWSSAARRIFNPGRRFSRLRYWVRQSLGR